MKRKKTKKPSEFIKVERTIEKELEKKRSFKDILSLVLVFLAICLATFFIAILFLFGKINLNLIKYKIFSEILPKVVSIQGLGSISSSKGILSTSQAQFDPYQLVLKFNANDSDFMLVDLRSKEEYEKEHIKNAINFPTYLGSKDGKNIEYDINKLVNELAKKEIKKYVIIYANFSGSQATKEIVGKLIGRGIPAVSLSIGWNEWRHFRNLWLPESQWNTFDASRYLYVGE